MVVITANLQTVMQRNCIRHTGVMLRVESGSISTLSRFVDLMYPCSRVVGHDWDS